MRFAWAKIPSHCIQRAELDSVNVHVGGRNFRRFKFPARVPSRLIQAPLRPRSGFAHPVFHEGLPESLKFSPTEPVRAYRGTFAPVCRMSHPLLPQGNHEPMSRIRLQTFGRSCATSLRQVREMTCRERDYLVSEFCKVGGLMPLLMKRRNHGAWTSGEKAELVLHMKRLRALSPYLVLTVVPGSFLALPVLAWWLDRRRQGRSRAEAATQLAAQSRRPGDSSA